MVQRHQRIGLHPSFESNSPEEVRVAVAGRAEPMLASIDEPSEADRCAAWYEAHRQTCVAICWAREARLGAFDLEPLREALTRHLAGESRLVCQALFTVGVIDAVYTSLPEGEGPRPDVLAGALLGKRPGAVRRLLSRGWCPFKQWAKKRRRSVAGSGAAFARTQAQRFFMPPLPAAAWTAVDGLVSTWIGDAELSAYLDRYDAFRARRAAADAPAAPPEAEALADDAWFEVERILREHEDFFRAVAVFNDLIASLGAGSRVG
jgi:hypothetical protein